MVTVIIFVILGIALFLRVFLDDAFYNEWWENIFISLGGVLVGTLIGGLIGFIIALALPCVPKDATETFEIVSLQDGNSLNGHFFLGSGNISDEMVYTFYYKTEAGGFKLKQVKSELTEIMYSSESPKAIRHYYVDGSWWNNFAIDFYESKWVIEIPEGSIKTNYVLDAN